MKTQFIFVRHGEASGNIDRIFHGFTNSELTENGKKQIKRVAARLQTEHIDYVCSSDLKRAYETALAIAEPHGLSVDIDPRFCEINGGLWENVHWDLLPDRYPESYNLWCNEPHTVQMPEGESMTDFVNRLKEGVHALLKEHAGQTICVATHGTAVRVLCCYFMGKPFTELNDIVWCDNAAVTICEHDETGMSVVLDGDNSHLADISTINDQDWWK